MEKKCSAVIIGVGPEQGLGATLASCFAGKDLHVFVAGRSEDKLHKVADKIRLDGGSATPVIADTTSDLEIANLFNKIRLDDYNIDIFSYNVGSNIPLPMLETDKETFTKLWQ